MGLRKSLSCFRDDKSDGSIEYAYYAEGGAANEWSYIEGFLEIKDNITQIDVTLMKSDSASVYVDDVFIGAVGENHNDSQDVYKYLAIGNSITVQPICDYWWSVPEWGHPLLRWITFIV